VAELQKTLDNLRDDLSQPYALNTEAGVQDYESSFTRMMSMIGEVRHNLRSIGEEVTRLKTLAQPPLRGQDAKIVYQALEQCRGGQKQSVDLVHQLREAVRNAAPRMTEAQVWAALRELGEQQWLYVRVE
ncbi:MAG: hypothetical protein GYB66_00060, partial [Chloroflexi bacterium]|nr:hypothetical protein [Chloroflexota bacterium]